MREQDVREMARSERLVWRGMIKVCVACGELIPEKRLQALPDTTTCVACSSATKKSIRDMPGTATVQHTGGLHEKYLKEEDLKP